MEAIIVGETDVMVGVRYGEMTLVPLVEATTKRKEVNLDLLRVMEITAT